MIPAPIYLTLMDLSFYELWISKHYNFVVFIPIHTTSYTQGLSEKLSSHVTFYDYA